MAANEPVDGERGVIVITASVAAFEGQIGQIPYASAKAGVAGMTLVAARDLARQRPRRHARPGHLRHADPVAALPRDQGRPGGPGPAPRAAGPTRGVRRAALHIVDNCDLNGETIRIDGAIRMWPRTASDTSTPTSSTASSSSRSTGPRPGTRSTPRPPSRSARRWTDSTTTARLVAGVITGAGGTFCAGMDLKAFLAGERPSTATAASRASSRSRRSSRSSRRWRATPSPAASRSRWPATCSSPPRTRSSGCPRSSAAWSPRAAGCSGCPSGCRTTSRWNGP